MTEDLTRIRVLCVDDHPVVRQGITMLLAVEPDMALVAEASNGREAIQQYRAHRPDVTLMDLQMPGMGGAEATAAIRRAGGSRSRVPIIAVTAHAMKEVREEILAAGMQDLITKPIDKEELAATIERWTGIDSKGAQRDDRIAENDLLAVSTVGRNLTKSCQ